MGINLVTYTNDHVSVAARALEVTNADFADGMNHAAANSPGIGIHTGITSDDEGAWTVLDQNGDARRPQESMHLGGVYSHTDVSDGSGSGSEEYPLKVIRGADLNDTISFVVAVEATSADGQGVLAGNTGPINRTGRTVVAGERVWGTDTV